MSLLDNDREPPDEPTIEDEIGDEVIPFEYTITSYGADYTVDSLVKRLRDGDMKVPSFQRSFVWNQKQASRFIESLLLGLPVPGIFLSKEPDSQQLLVIDGQQRLSSLRYFYDGVWPNTDRVFRLVDVQQQFEGATYDSLGDPERRRLNDSIIHATVVRQEAPSEDESSIYHIFERINTGARPLQPQEIRSSIYHGPFVALLEELNNLPAWRTVYGTQTPHLRLRDRELLLRFLALYFESELYTRPMKEFLNKFMARHRKLARRPAEDFRSIVVGTCTAMANGLEADAMKPKGALNAAVLDSVMVGVAARGSRAPITNPRELGTAFAALQLKQEWQRACEKATADAEQVKARLEAARAAFNSVR